jgi:uncharacterized MAPEG superfamily protein
MMPAPGHACAQVLRSVRQFAPGFDHHRLTQPEEQTVSIEIRMLVWSVVLGLVQILLATMAAAGQRGAAWAASSRDEPLPTLTGVAGRLDRARANFLETFAFFAALVLAVVALGRHDATSALGAQLYFWARLVYVPVYAAGIPYLRTLVWAVSIAGLVMLLVALF